jgi:biotin operon repressor
LGATEWEILELVFNFNATTIDKIADTLDMSTTAIEKNIRKLKKKAVFPV